MISAIPWLIVAFAFWFAAWLTTDYIYDYCMSLIERYKRAHRKSHR